jgi:hypothetical protein
MRGFVAPLLFAASVIAAALPPGAAATPIFVLDSDEATYTLIHRVNPQTGQLTTLGALPPDEIVAGLAAESDDVLYALSHAGTLFRITVAPFTITVVGFADVSNSVGLAYGDGALYAVDDSSGNLSRIDPATAATSFIGQVRLANDSFQVQGGDLAQAGNGTWYLWTNASQALYTLDVTTAIATPVSDQQGGPWLTGLAVDYQNGGTLYGSAVFSDELNALDPSTGMATSFIPLCVDCPQQYDLAWGDLASPRCTDTDGDGFSAGGPACGPVDCNDGAAGVNPLAAEACNGVDDDCDGVVDDGASAACSDGNACTIGDSCQAGTCRAGAPRNCGLLNLIGATCRPSDGACCGKLVRGLLPLVTVCLN